MAIEHTVKAYEEELNSLKQAIARMGSLAEAQLQTAMQALVRHDGEMASKAVQSDSLIDDLERQVSGLALRVLALRQPMAGDLREVISALKISSELERIGDYAANIGKRVTALSQTVPFKLPAGIPRMGWLVQNIINEVMRAYLERAVDKAVAAWQKDEEVDETYSGLFRELLSQMMEDPRSISACIHLLFVAKNIERIGDHATNIAETIHYMVAGQPLDAVRPKRDETSMMTMPLPTGQ